MIFSKSWEIFGTFFGTFLGILWEFFGNVLRILWKCFENSLEILWEFSENSFEILREFMTLSEMNRVFEYERSLCFCQDFGLGTRKENLNQ